MKASVIVFPGSNCDRDVQIALSTASGKPVEMIWHGESELPKTDLIVLPGGFSYGDYLRSGAMSARSPIMQEVITKAGQGVAILGICNGFQVLTETGLLPGALLRNAGLKFVCRNVQIRVENNQTPFTNIYKQGEILSIPIAHHDGQYFAQTKTLAKLIDQERIAFRYYCDNPNGSVDDIAGIFNERKNVLGLMPHPERAADTIHGSIDGQGMMQSLIKALS